MVDQDSDRDPAEIGDEVIETIAPQEPPLEPEETNDASRLEDGIACCLSGGGYRAMVFHLGALWRLNELGLLRQVQRFSSVSGGSITSAVLALHWKRLKDNNFSTTAFVEHCVEPVRWMARQSIDVAAVGWGILNPFRRISDLVADKYDELFQGATLDSLPTEPRWVINATNVKTGVLWRFSQKYTGDYRVGLIPSAKKSFRLAEAVAASAAFPPYLSPYVLKLNPADFDDTPAELTNDAFRREAVLTDGGVYDNLGLETAIKRYRTLLVSDGGRNTEADADPAEDWTRHSYRVIEILQQQINSLQKRRLIEALRGETYSGAYWGLHTNLAELGLADPINISAEKQAQLSQYPTRLASMSENDQQLLINFGYAKCDGTIRRFYLPEAATPQGLPYPESPL